MREHNFTIHKTRFKNLGYLKQDKSLWRFVDLQDRTVEDFPRLVGQSYPTKIELLADLERYARDVWGY